MGWPVPSAGWAPLQSARSSPATCSPRCATALGWRHEIYRAMHRVIQAATLCIQGKAAAAATGMLISGSGRPAAAAKAQAACGAPWLARRRRRQRLAAALLEWREAAAEAAAE
eukprot:scaffold29064_cov51-Phaeocystis_antarctica.AAC.1